LPISFFIGEIVGSHFLIVYQQLIIHAILFKKNIGVSDQKHGCFSGKIRVFFERNIGVFFRQPMGYFSDRLLPIKKRCPSPSAFIKKEERDGQM